MNKNSNFVAFIMGGSSTVVKNVGFENVNIKGNNQTAAIISGDGVLNNCYVTGKVEGTWGVGAIAGQLRGSINNCYAKCDVTGTSSCVGGLAGYLIVSGNNEKCFFEGSVQSSTNQVGGIVGKLEGSGGTRIKNCYSKGSVSGVNYIGGICGDVDGGHFQNCYSGANISGKGSYVGGLLGRIDNGICGNEEIASCYASGNVKGKSYVGGIIGGMATINTSYTYTKTISNVYSTGDVSGTGSCVGGLCGQILAGTTITNAQSTGNVSAGSGSVGGAFGIVASATASASKTINLSNITSYSDVPGGAYKGSLIGSVQNTLNGSTFTAVNVTNCKAVGNDFVGRVCRYNTDTSSTETIDYDTSSWGISAMTIPVTKVTLQTGLYSENTSQISFDLGFNYDLDAIVTEGCTSDSAYTAINNFINTLGQKETELGAITNRLDSALESVYVSMDNLISSRSTIQDADMSNVSSQFIRQQILQQACATLMATANQSPSIAMQLL